MNTNDSHKFHSFAELTSYCKEHRLRYVAAASDCPDGGKLIDSNGINVGRWEVV